MAAFIGTVAAAASQMAAAREFNNDVHSLVDPVFDKYVEPIVSWTKRKIDEELKRVSKKVKHSKELDPNNMDWMFTPDRPILPVDSVSNRKPGLMLFPKPNSYIVYIGKKKFRGCKRIKRKHRRRFKLK